MEVLENRLDFENCYIRTAGDGASGSRFVREACSKLRCLRNEIRNSLVAFGSLKIKLL